MQNIYMCIEKKRPLTFFHEKGKADISQDKKL